MTLNTYGLNVRSSFHELMTAHALALQDDINAMLGTAYDIPYYSQKQPESFPSIRGWVYLRDEPNARRHRLQDGIQVDLFIQSEDPTFPNLELLELMAINLRERMGLRTKRSAFHGYFPVLDYASDPDTPRQIGKCKIEGGGWKSAPDDDAKITRLLADFKLTHL